MKLFGFEKAKNKKLKIYVFGIKIQVNISKNYFHLYKRNFFITASKIAAFFNPKLKKKRYEIIVPLGRDCELATVYKYFFKSFIDSSLYNWALYGENKMFFECVKDPSKIFTGQIEFIPSENMYRCLETGFLFHGNSSAEKLLDKDGNIVEEIKIKEQKDTIAKIEYLKEKNNLLYKNTSKKLYIFTLDVQDIKDDLCQLKDLYSFFTTQNPNFDMLIIIEKSKYCDEIKEFESQYKNLFFRKISYFRTLYPERICHVFDYYKDWAEIFSEFNYEHLRKKTDKKLKCEGRECDIVSS